MKGREGAVELATSQRWPPAGHEWLVGKSIARVGYITL